MTKTVTEMRDETAKAMTDIRNNILRRMTATIVQHSVFKDEHAHCVLMAGPAYIGKSHWCSINNIVEVGLKLSEFREEDYPAVIDVMRSWRKHFKIMAIDAEVNDFQCEFDRKWNDSPDGRRLGVLKELLTEAGWSYSFREFRRPSNKLLKGNLD